MRGPLGWRPGLTREPRPAIVVGVALRLGEPQTLTVEAW
jgi:hypothetical protein